ESWLCRGRRLYDGERDDAGQPASERPATSKSSFTGECDPSHRHEAAGQLPSATGKPRGRRAPRLCPCRGGVAMNHKTDRRAVLRLLTAAPLGLAVSAALIQDAQAQTTAGAPRAQASTG